MNAITLELNAPTEANLADLCQRSRVPPTEVLRRALQAAAAPARPSTPEERRAALRELQRVAQMTPEKAEARIAAIRDARR